MLYNTTVTITPLLSANKFHKKKQLH